MHKVRDRIPHGSIALPKPRGKILGTRFHPALDHLETEESTGLNLVFQSGGSNFLKEFAWGITLLVVLAIGGRRYSRLGRASKGRGQTPRTVRAGCAVAP